VILKYEPEDQISFCYLRVSFPLYRCTWTAYCHWV